MTQSEMNRAAVLSTSGTTGKPKRVYFTREDLELTIDFFHYGMANMVQPGHRVLILLDWQRPGALGHLFGHGLNRCGAFGIFPSAARDVQYTLEIIDRKKINTLIGAPSDILPLVRHSTGTTAPDNILLTSEFVPDLARNELRNRWGSKVYTHYGMAETGFGGGMECDARHGYHLQEGDLYFEIIDPQTGMPVAEGECGEIVITTLTRKGMPLIRYRTGDVSRFVLRPCLCGTVLRTLSEEIGRVTPTLCGFPSGVNLNRVDWTTGSFRPVHARFPYRPRSKPACGDRWRLSLQ